jgi:tripartite-type tricarboxylate transporter receptor subunit TctC
LDVKERIALAVAALMLVTSGLCAQPYPTRPIKVLMGFPAGGAPDTVLRRIAARLEPRLGVPIVVENRLGASGTIAATAVARSEPSGYTLLFGVAANMAVAPAVMKDVPYDPVAAFAPIVEVARGPYVFLVRGDAPVHDMREFVAWARAQPGKLNYASPGIGSVHYFATEMLLQATHVAVTHIPTSGSLYPTILGGQVDAMFDSMPSPLPHLASGKLRALAVTGDRRLPALPAVPTLAEQRLEGVDVSSWWGFVGPAGMPHDAIARLNAEIRAVLNEPELKAGLASMAIEPSPGSPEAFGTFIAQEAVRWRQIAARFAKN